MDSQKKNELSDRRREEALSRRMGEALDRLSPDDVRSCPDAEIIAAYHEQALAPEEALQWESHFAVCSRCRKILAVLAASTEAPLAESEVARLGELVASATRTPQTASPQKIKPIRPRSWDWRVRWLAPALGVAAALAVWFAMRPPWRATSPESSGTLIAQAPKNDEMPPSVAPSELDRLSKAPSQPDNAVKATIPRDLSGTNPPVLMTHPERQTAPGADGGNAIGTLAPDGIGSLQNENKPRDASNEAPSAFPASAPPIPSPKQPSMQAPAPLRPKTESELSTNAGAAVQSETSADALSGGAVPEKKEPAAKRASREAVTPEASARSAMSTRIPQTLSLFKAASETPIVIKAPHGSALWRAGTDGSIERSIDAGRTWVSQASPGRDGWLAGNAVSDKISWLAGRNGAIARTTDGEHWERVEAPEIAADPTGKLPDWTGVIGQDAQVATVIASDGRHFATRDGGKTWQLQ